LAVQAVQAVTTQLRHQPEKRQEQDLVSAQQIGVAIGVLMARYGAGRQEAAQMLRAAAQDTGRELPEVAGEVIETETLRLPPMPAGPHSTGRNGTPRPCGGSR
jgi:AmiR/NasT family two-component response regulator